MPEGDSCGKNEREAFLEIFIRWKYKFQQHNNNGGKTPQSSTAQEYNVYIDRTYYIPIHIHKNKNILYIDHHLIALCCYQSRYQGVTFSILVALHNYNNVWGFFFISKKKR